MPGSPRKRARRAAIDAGTVTPGQTHTRRHVDARHPSEAETAEVCRALEVGWYIETAWAAIGVSRDMGRSWLDRGRNDPEGPYGDHARRVGFAREAGIQLLHQRVLDGSTEATLEERTYDGEGALLKRKTRTERGDVRAAQWALERMDPQRFMSRVRLEVEGEMKAVLDVLERELDAATYARILGAIALLGADRPE